MRVNGDEGTPVPIPNTVVKLINGDNTWLVTAREDNTTRTQYSLIAQSVEHAAVNRGVVGSSPTWGAIKDNGCRCRLRRRHCSVKEKGNREKETGL